MKIGALSEIFASENQAAMMPKSSSSCRGWSMPVSRKTAQAKEQASLMLPARPRVGDGWISHVSCAGSPTRNLYNREKSL
jgi:hypothetical protein